MYRFNAALSSAERASGPSSEVAAQADQVGPLGAELLARLHRYWSAANYLCVGQIYLQANALLREPLLAEHIKPRLLGHWGTSVGQNFIYVHLNRLISERGAQVVFISGPGHGGPTMNACAWLEGTYSEVHPEIGRDEVGMLRFFRSFSTPGGIPSHCGPHTPNSMHEGGELGYSLLHAFGAVFDNPDLLVACVIGDGEAETCPLEGSWKSIHFLNPRRDGAVLPILHLNGYKISGPTVEARFADEDLISLYRGRGYEPLIVAGDDLPGMHQRFAAALNTCHDGILRIQDQARNEAGEVRARWPMIILRSPKGWTGPKVVDGLPVEGTFRAHQVPVANVRSNAEHLRQLETWMRSYGVDSLFSERGELLPDLQALNPPPHLRMGSVTPVKGCARLGTMEHPYFAG